MADHSDRQEPRIIEPVEFRSSTHRVRRTLPIMRWLMLFGGALIIVVAGGVGWMALTWQRVEIAVSPAPSRLELDGPAPRFEFSGGLYVRPGTYAVSASLKGYRELGEQITVSRGQDNRFEFELQPLPGVLTFTCTNGADGSEITGAAVYVDGQLVGQTPLERVEVEQGPRIISFEHERYVAAEAELEVAGLDQHQQVALTLRPDWAEVTIGSSPTGAEILVDGVPVGMTPSIIELLSGSHALEIRTGGHDPWRTTLTIVAERPVSLADIVLSRVKGRLVVTTTPPGAQIMVGDTYVGSSPLEADVAPDEDLLVQAALDGFAPARASVLIESGEVRTLELDLAPEVGIVRFEIVPEDAQVSIDGGPWQPIRSEVQLSAVEHQLQFAKEGFEPVVRTIRPRPGLPLSLGVTLNETVSVPTLVAGNGYAFVLIAQGNYTMGTSRRERDRRTNETLRKVTLERPFLMGTREVTNAEFREFNPRHDSGAAATVPLDGATRPVVRVSWDDAARYCNWLSARDGLPMAYEEKKDTMHAVEPMTTGYRLPSEAEWAFVARIDGAGAPLTYPWGQRYPPPPLSGNFADKSSAALMSRWIEEYDDGFPGPAPVASFKPNGLGVHDLGGNAAEWCNDYYTTYTYNPSKTEVDPLGPPTGKHHVVRGSSWRHYSMTTLRLPYRDYSNEARDDLGFRLCRYVEQKEKAE